MRGGTAQVASILDIFIISEDLLLSSQSMTSWILPFGRSDHWPVQLEASFIGTLRNRSFRFKNAWLTHPNFISNIRNWWGEDMPTQGTKMFLLHQRLKHIKQRLKEWNRNEFGNIFEAKREVERKLQEVIKFLSRKDSQRKGKDERTFCSKNGTIDASRKKSSGDRNLE